MDLTGQVVLITGGSRGLGRAFAQALLAAGAPNAATRRRDADALSGRYISVEDDIDALLKECSADPSADQRLLRVNGVAAFYEGWKRL